MTRPRRALRSHRHNGEVYGFQLHAHFGGNLRKTPNASHRPLLYSRMRALRIIWGMKAVDADTISFVWTSIQQRYSVKRGGSRSCLTCAKCGAMGNCHTSGSSPRSGAGFSALLCSNAGSWTRSRTPGNFSLWAPSTKAQLKWASARYKDSYAIRRYDPAGNTSVDRRLAICRLSERCAESVAGIPRQSFKTTAGKLRHLYERVFTWPTLPAVSCWWGFPWSFCQKPNDLERWLLFSHNQSCLSLFRLLNIYAVYSCTQHIWNHVNHIWKY